MVSESPTPGIRAASRALDSLAPGKQGAVAALRGPEEVTTKLAEAGFVPGAIITLVRRAPLGSPLEVAVDGARFTLRAEDAAAVLLVDAP